MLIGQFAATYRVTGLARGARMIEFLTGWLGHHAWLHDAAPAQRLGLILCGAERV